MLSVLLVLQGLISFLAIKHVVEPLDVGQNLFETHKNSIISILDIHTGIRGTGFVAITRTGQEVVVTNKHVCLGIQETAPRHFLLYVTANEQKMYALGPSTILAIDEFNDLCLLSLPKNKHTKPLDLAEKVEQSQKIYLIGFPTEPILSLSEGRIRGFIIKEEPVNKSITLCLKPRYVVRYTLAPPDDSLPKITAVCHIKLKYMYADATNDMGASGSPALSPQGEVVGVMSMVASEYKSMSYLVPLEYLKAFLAQY